jgi:hypothetical protein
LESSPSARASVPGLPAPKRLWFAIGTRRAKLDDDLGSKEFRGMFNIEQSEAQS